MDFQIVSRKIANESRVKHGRTDWAAIVGSLAPNNAIKIQCADSKTMRTWQPRIYEAALRAHKSIETFKTTEGGQLFLNVILK